MCDFGLARVTNSATTLENMKFRDIGGFSPRYAAPEVLAAAALMISGDSEVDKKSDVYSFAIILWELLTRRIPWEGLNKEQIEVCVRSGERVRDSLMLVILVFFFISLFQQLPLPTDDGADPAKSILIELCRTCWHDNPATRPPFSNISTKITSLL